MAEQILTANQQVLPFQETLLTKPARDLIFVAFDTEATGRHPLISGLLEIAAIKFSGAGEILESRTQLINPSRAIPSVVTAVHGITDEMVAEMPRADAVIPEFVEWMCAPPALGTSSVTAANQNVFVAHNAVFDVSFLQVLLTRLGLALPANPVLDTLPLSRNLISESKNHRLKTLIEHLGGSKNAAYHRAEVDSRHVLEVFLELIRRAGKNCTLGDLVDAGGIMFFSKPFELIEDLRSARDKRVHRIGEAIDSGADLQIHYNGHGTRFRRITPYSVLYAGKRYYLNAYCHAAGNERTFKVNRICTLEMVERIAKVES